MRHFPIIALSMLALACASGGSKSASPSAPGTTAPKASETSSSDHDSSQLTLEEITSANLPTAYDLVDRLRRPWLRRDAVTGGDVVVYMETQNFGGAEKLRDILSVDVAGMQYFPNEDAVKRWGADIKGSVILVSRRR